MQLDMFTGSDAYFTISNQLDQRILVYWISWSGAPSLYFSVGPGASATHHTYVGNGWVAATENDVVVRLNGACWYICGGDDLVIAEL